MGKIGLVSLVLIEILLGGLDWQKSPLQSIEAEYFEGKGHWVTGELLSKEAPRFLESEPKNNTINKSILSLKVRAYPEQAVTPLNGGQTIFVIVQDQRLLPVQGAQVSLVIRMPSGEEDRIIIPTLTDKNGITQFAFSYTASTIGIVEIKVTVVHEKLQAKTSTCFMLWW